MRSSRAGHRVIIVGPKILNHTQSYSEKNGHRQTNKKYKFLQIFVWKTRVLRMKTEKRLTSTQNLIVPYIWPNYNCLAGTGRRDFSGGVGAQLYTG